MRRLSPSCSVALLFTAIAVRATVAQDFPTRLAAVRDATSVEVLHASRPVQINFTANELGQPSLHATLLSYVGGTFLPGEIERHLNADLVAVMASPSDPSDPRQFTAALIRNSLASDVTASPGESGLRLGVSSLAVDTQASTLGGQGIAVAPTPWLASNLRSLALGWSEVDIRTLQVLSTTLQVVSVSGSGARALVYRDDPSHYALDVTAESGSAALELSDVSLSNGVPQAGTITVLSSSLAGQACFAPVLAAGEARSSPGSCLPLQAGAHALLDLAALAGLAGTAPCVEDDAAGTYCLYDQNRFEVRGTMSDFASPPAEYALRAIRNAQGQAARGAKPGFAWILLYAFDATNPEAMIKLLDGCAFNGKIWVFGAQSTNAASRIEIRDTRTGATRAYSNLAGTTALAIADSAAFECE